MDIEFTHKSALFSECRRYRYRLARRWHAKMDAEVPILNPRVPNGSIITWLMLNPSTADEVDEDPTIRRCIDFSYRWGFGGLEIVNLFALRSTDPDALLIHPDPVGPDNDRAIFDASAEGAVTICAWGSIKKKGMVVRAKRICAELIHQQRRLYMLNVTSNKHPIHPLYQLSDTMPLPWTFWSHMQ